MRNFWNNMTIVRRITFVLLSYISILIVASMTAKMAYAASLKDISVVTTDKIMLKDLFDGVKRNANYVIGPAPKPGEDMVLNARTLYRIAVAMDLPWRPTSSGDTLTVRRDATIVPFIDIEKAIKSELVKNGVNGRYTLTLDDGNKSIVLDKNLPRSVEISAMSFDPTRDIFNATLVAPSAANPVKKINVNGAVTRLVQVPVLREPLRNGMIIGQNDLDYIDMPAKDLQHDTLFKKDDLLGMTPRRIAHAGKPLNVKELQRPQIVSRGEFITIYFKQGPLLLSAKGKALENGAKGDRVTVSNLGSSKNFDAIVSNKNEVIVN